MKRVFTGVVVFLFGILFSFLALADQPKNLIIVGWDGAGLKNVIPLLEEGRLPNLKKVIEQEGGLYPLQNITQTVTIPNWTMFFTGMTYDQTGVLGNQPALTPKQEAAFLLRMRQREENSLTLFRFNAWIVHLPAHWFFPMQLKRQLGMKVGWITAKKYLSAEAGRSPMSDFVSATDYHV